MTESETMYNTINGALLVNLVKTTMAKVGLEYAAPLEETQLEAEVVQMAKLCVEPAEAQ